MVIPRHYVFIFYRGERELQQVEIAKLLLVTYNETLGEY